MNLEATHSRARARLLEERNPEGWWTGELSSSALSTATSVVALHGVDERAYRDLIRAGAAWLVAQQNGDGGWGDTVRSFSNISTTLLCWSALHLVASEEEDALRRAAAWIEREVGSSEPARIAERVRARYGKDRTFAVPILMMCATCGTLGGERNEAWRRVLPLPFELAAFPRSWFAALRLPVVSYALPALIAIGYARHYHAPAFWPLRTIRGSIWPRVSGLLTKIQPESGGFLEAAPLTGFVTMALAGAGQREHPVAQRGIRFLVETRRADGSWPIDTNLATWVTTLAVKALWGGRGGPDPGDGEARDRAVIRDWILGQQYRVVHPFTNAAPGGWAWTDLSGGVPDADDTPGAMLALRILDPESEDVRAAAERGAIWLADLQNRDGGIPTFCKGWGALPFDRSSADLTAHTLRAWHVWHGAMPEWVRRRLDRGRDRALRYLASCQDAEGWWAPLWFGNQHERGETNRIYGTALVLQALCEIEGWPGAAARVRRLREPAEAWLCRAQREDGSFGGLEGGPPSIEETALGGVALRVCGRIGESNRAAAALAHLTRDGQDFPASPIGFYFAKLWYFERLYPLVWGVAAL